MKFEDKDEDHTIKVPAPKTLWRITCAKDIERQLIEDLLSGVLLEGVFEIKTP